MHEHVIQFTSGHWSDTQKNYSTIKKEILSIVLCITKFQDDLEKNCQMLIFTFLYIYI